MTKTTLPQVTFAVDPVEAGQELLPTEKPKASVEKLLGSPSRRATTTTPMSSSNPDSTA